MTQPNNFEDYSDEGLEWDHPFNRQMYDEMPRRGGTDPVPNSAEECEFGDEEYQWRLWQAGL